MENNTKRIYNVKSRILESDRKIEELYYVVKLMDKYIHIQIYMSKEQEEYVLITQKMYSIRTQRKISNPQKDTQPSTGDK